MSDYTPETAAREAAERFWEAYGWNPGWEMPSIEDLANHIAPYITEAMRRSEHMIETPDFTTCPRCRKPAPDGIVKNDTSLTPHQWHLECWDKHVEWLRIRNNHSCQDGPGMYKVADPTYPQVKVGKYTICRQDESSIWIQTDDGIGGQFTYGPFEEVVDKFFRANF